jgi:hypothetical protein
MKQFKNKKTIERIHGKNAKIYKKAKGEYMP